ISGNRVSLERLKFERARWSRQPVPGCRNPVQRQSCSWKPPARHSAVHAVRAQGPREEFFPEAFFIYNTDPEWLKAGPPKVFEWFENLTAGLEAAASKKGKSSGMDRARYAA